MIANFSVRQQSAATYGHRSAGAPLTKIAEWVHADLYGLPFDREDTSPTVNPRLSDTDLRDLADAAQSATTPHERDRVLERLLHHLPHLVAILDSAASWAEQHPTDAEHFAGRINSASALTHQMTAALARAHHAVIQHTPTATVGTTCVQPTPPPAPAGRPARR